MYPSRVSMYIGGKPIDDRSLQPVINPATEQIIGNVATARTDDLEAAITAAIKGFEIWKKMPAFDRTQIMLRAATLLRERAEKIGWLMTLEQGKPLSQSTFEVARAAGEIEWAANEGLRSYGRLIPARDKRTKVEALKFPVGPVALFTPWNFPVNQLARKLGPALAAGCSVIAKAPEETPAAPAELIKAFIEAGVPPGVVNLLYGDPGKISDHLIAHPAIRKISFTGSIAVGKQLAEACGRHMKRATMELGGNAPVLVFADADIDLAIRHMSGIKYFNAGQTCATPNRFIVHETLYDKFVSQFVEASEKINIGNGLEQGIQMGPLANSRRLIAMENMVTDALDRRAMIKTGGTRIGCNGYFFSPTVITDVDKDAEVRNQEAFGPLSVITPFSSYEEAIAEANRLPVGLVSYAFTRDLNTIHQLSEQIDAGTLIINNTTVALPEMPYGGVKDSGFGIEGGYEGIDTYQAVKLVTYTA